MREVLMQELGDVTLYIGDALETLKTLPDESVNCIVTSPPYYGLRDYSVEGQIGLEQTPQEFIAKLVEVFREVRRVLRSDGTCWVNMGDSYAGSWGAQSRENPGNQSLSTLQGGSTLSARQIKAHPKGDHTGSLKNTPGLKPKDLIGIPWKLAFGLQEDGWWLRQDIIWSKPNPMPESVKDRCTKAHEYIFMLSKSERYWYDQDAIKEPMSMSSVDRLTQANINNGSDRVPGKTNGPMKAVGKVDKQRGHVRRHAGFNDRWDAMTKEEQCSGMRNKRSVWTVSTQPYKEAHFATFPPKLIEPCILAGCPEGGTVLDPFAGSGTTGQVVVELGRKAVLIELNPEYGKLIEKRVTAAQQQGRLFA